MNDLISVIVPVYNVEKYLNKCIESIVNQSYTNLEIILVDDGSPDNCPAICDVWAEKDSRIKVIHKKNGGLSDARNAGLAIATGEYISFVDSDDFIEIDFHEKLYNVIKNTDSDISICNLRMVHESKNVVDDTSDTLRITEYSTLEAMSALIDDKIRQVVWNKLYKIAIIRDILFDIGKYHEDEFWSYKAIGAANKIVAIDYTGYNYLQRSGSIMGTDYSLKRLDAVEAKCFRQEYLKNKHPSLIQKGITNIIFTCIYHGQLSIKHLNKNDKKIAFKILTGIINNYLSLLELSKLNPKQKIWIYSSKLSFLFTCIIRNIFNRGF